MESGFIAYLLIVVAFFLFFALALLVLAYFLNLISEAFLFIIIFIKLIIQLMKPKRKF